MTAVVAVKALTRAERQRAERREWTADAVGYMYLIGLFTQDEIELAYDLALSLCEHAVDEGGELMYTAEEAVEEDLTYW